IDFHRPSSVGDQSAWSSPHPARKPGCSDHADTMLSVAPGYNRATPNCASVGQGEYREFRLDPHHHR
ncbi:hypothetical protein, partial [Bradyrhizobium sp.]|uniref:hypothetical protein n=1 Tax=Bradyrhizobium sp. TaxID=376 RepID=UPI003C6635D8